MRLEKLKKIILIVFFTLVSSNYGSTNSLQILLNIALKNNTQLQSLKAQYLKQKNLILPAYIPADPQISYNAMNIPVNTYRFDLSPMSSQQIKIKQMLLFPPKLIIKGNIKRNETDIARLSYLLFKNKLKLNVKLKFYEIVYLRNLIKFANAKRIFLDKLKTIVRTKYEVGKGLQQDLLEINVRMSYIDKMMIMLNMKTDNKIEELKQLLNVNDLPEDITFDTPTQFTNYSNVIINKSNLLQSARQNFPEILIKKTMLKKSQNLQAMSAWQFFPDIMLGTTYSIRNNNLPDGGTDFYSFSVGVTLPIYMAVKQIPLSISSHYNKKASEKIVTDSVTKTVKNFKNYFRMYRKNLEMLNLFKTQIIPQSQLSLDSSIQAYQVDKVDFMNVIQNFFDLYNAYENKEETIFEINNAKAKIEFYSGVQL